VISLFAQLGEGFTPIHTGLTFVPMTVGMVAAIFPVAVDMTETVAFAWLAT